MRAKSLPRRIFVSVVFWLSLLNTAAALARLPILSWLAQRRRDAALGLGVAGLAYVLQRPQLRWFPFAVPLQLVAASIRGFWYHPVSRLRSCAENRCTVVQIPLGDDLLPGLLLRPVGPTQGGVVLCHGAGADKTYYAWRIITALLEAELLVLAIDLDGHGENQRVLRLPDLVDDVRVAVEWLRDQVDAVGVVGVSLGGCVAARAVADGVLVDALAIIEAPRELDLRRRTYLPAELRSLLRPAFWRAADRVTPWQLLRGWNTVPTRTTLSTAETIRRLDLADALTQIACPMLLLYSTDDVIAPFAPIQVLLDAMNDAVLMLHGGAGHLSLTLEAAPLHDLTAWLRDRMMAAERAM